MYCPVCESQRIGRTRRQAWMKLLLVKQLYECDDCRRRFLLFWWKGHLTLNARRACATRGGSVDH